MYNPVSTYRLQFNKDFTFEKAHHLIDYFHQLGTGTIYASPVFSATTGSVHGYDITNPHTINPEIGSEEELCKLTKSLKNRRIGWLQDIVPNHTAFNHHNPWIMDVLEKGRDSEFDHVFDIDRQHPKFLNKVMVPFLGNELPEVINAGELKLTFSGTNFQLTYFDKQWPVSFESFLWIMEQADQELPGALAHILERYEPEKKSPDYLFLNGEWERFKTELHRLCLSNQEVLSFLENLSADISAEKDALQNLCENQHYKLAHWKDTEQEINYRRFFTINDLICLKMSDKEVFNLYHREINRWLRQHFFDGLRVDHVDGLRHPEKYLTRLRKLAGNQQYIAVEKILEQGENLPETWPVQGTSGYDFLAQVNNLFTRQKSMPQLQSLYRKVTGREISFEKVIYESKHLILSERMQGEWENLTTLFLHLHLLDEDAATRFSREQIKTVIGEILLAMPLYRLYSETLPLQGNDRKIMQKVLRKANEQNPETNPLIPVFEELLFDEKRTKGDRDERIITFFSRLMQYSGPLMAKGMEDTTMYRYHSFIGHNEVGDNPSTDGLNIDEFHNVMLERNKHWPLTLNTTSTHDTKRGEDVRARLNIISEIPDEWEEMVLNWSAMNKPLKKKVDGREAPSPAEEYLIYQTLIGVIPFEDNPDKTFIQRMSDYMEKALREAKVNSAWNDPNIKWENAVKSFIEIILSHGQPFLESLLKFHEKTAHYGVFNSLSQLTLKCTCPGIPDIYQGTELWDLTLVDPDNRQPVDFQLNHTILRTLKSHYTLNPKKLFHNLLHNIEDGHIKLWLTHRLLRYRKENPSLFAHGDYIPLKVKGILKKHVMAYARHHKNLWHLTIVPLHISSFEINNKRITPGEVDWKNTRVILPGDSPQDWVNIYSGRPYSVKNEISVAEVFDSGPVGILHADSGRKTRSAGVLMHITSLPGRFASGDFGPGAYQFIDFLKESGHSYWQVLPFTQTTDKWGWSPYSAPSAFAGNIIFISPHKLFKESLISKKEMKSFECALSEKADFKKALSIRNELTKKAYENFTTYCSAPAKQNFYDFCEQEKHWLDDYVLFTLLKHEYGEKTWAQWPEKIRDRDKEALDKFAGEHEKEMDLEKYRQYLFAQQWEELKQYANHHGIRIIGDIPIYVGYDNADVWSHPQLFKLDADKNMSAVAGVPPDYFSETGQLWNMPVYNWKKAEKEDFQWWMNRLHKNLELYDLVRLDHFRGFEAYWEVPANDDTAENGVWVKAPGKAFLTRVKKEFPDMPFIAEDLGEIDDDVYTLRDKFELPGMKVLQFAFGNELPESVHIPHNHTYNSVVFTGTHDNNTAKGWYNHELDKAGKKRIKLYTGAKVKSKDIHRILTHLAWASQAKLVIVPVQDLIGRDQEAQMNRPSVANGNWTWRLKTLDELYEIAGETRELLGLFAR